MSDCASVVSANETTGWKPVVHDRQDACPPAKCEDGVHQGGFPGGAGGLDNDAEGLVHQAGGACQIGRELVGGLAHGAGGVKSPGDTLQQVRGAEEFERGGAGGGPEDAGGMTRGFGSGGGKAPVLEHFEGQEELAEVALDEVLGQAGFLGRTLDEAAAFVVAAQVEGVEVEKAAGFGEP